MPSEVKAVKDIAGEIIKPQWDENEKGYQSTA
jgi:hypothetical protein